MQIILPLEFKPEKFKINSSEVVKNGAMRSVLTSYFGPNGQPGPLRIQLPQMRCPFGLKQMTDPKTGKPLNENKMSFNLSLADMENRPSIKATMSMMDQLKEIAIEEGAKNSQKWFGKNLSKDIIDNLFYKSNIKYPIKKNEKGESTGEINPDYPPTMTFSLYVNDGKISGNAIDMKDRPIDLNQVDIKGALITPIVQITNMWLGNGMFGFSWKVLKMQVIPRPKNNNGIAFRNDIDRIGNTDDEAEENVSEVQKEEINKASKIPMHAPTLDESEEEV